MKLGSRVLTPAGLILTALLHAGCLTNDGSAGAKPPEVQGNVTEISDEAFAGEVVRLLRDGTPSPDRQARLSGVVKRQLEHVSKRFGHGARRESRAAQGVFGALYLLRQGEGRTQMIDAAGDKALAGAIERVSARGDEGRALALLKMRSAALAPGAPARAEVDGHLDALDQWIKGSRRGGPLRKLGEDERIAVSRAMLEPTDQTLDAAVTAVNAWVKQAVEYNDTFRETGQRPDREEVIEVQRALESGGITVTALFLRYGDARGALQVLEQTGLRGLVLPAVFARLQAAATNDGAREWLSLAAAFAHRDLDPDLDPELISAALLGASTEAYRRDTKSFDASLFLARALVRHGMPEAAPLVIQEALSVKPTARAVSAAMDLVIGAIEDSAEMDDIDTARRTFRSAAGVLALASQPDLRGQVEPSAARARFAMAGLEVRAGNLTDAKPLLEEAARAEPSVGAYTTLAVVERQSGRTKEAIAAVDQALRAPDARVAVLDVADAYLTAFELHRDAGEADRAKTSLDQALTAALAARSARGTPGQVRAERLLGRILEGYGDMKGASRAFDRALQLAASDRQSLGTAMLDAIGRALVRRDLPAARAALKKGIDGLASDEDLAYASLWVALLERELKAAPDGTVERGQRGVAGKSSWTAKLTAWSAGKMSDADLVNAAQSPAQKVEAAFYTAMVKRIAGDPGAADALRKVAASPVIDLLEVRLARDLTASPIRAALPSNVQLP